MTAIPISISFGELEILLVAETPADFRQLLGRIRRASGRSLGEIEIKTEICRSQAHSLGSSRLSGLPRDRAQVRDFVWACGLNECEIAGVLELWDELHYRNGHRTRSTHRSDRG